VDATTKRNDLLTHLLMRGHKLDDALGQRHAIRGIKMSRVRRELTGKVTLGEKNLKGKLDPRARFRIVQATRPPLVFQSNDFFPG